MEGKKPSWYFRILMKAQHVRTYINRMRLLLAFVILISSSLAFGDERYLLVFNNDGSFYRFTPDNRVHWKSSLKFDLISFNLPSEDPVGMNNTYFIPTLDGNFLYIHRNRQILVERAEVEALLHVCFEMNPILRSANTLSDATQYFVYEKYQYYVLNALNGELTEIELFLQSGCNFQVGYFAILKVSKKFLKQLVSDKIKWSVLSSVLDLTLADQFFRSPKSSSSENDHLLQESGFTFRRVSNRDLVLTDRSTSTSLDIGGVTPVVAVFSSIGKKGFLNHPLHFEIQPSSALENKHNKSPTSPATEIKLIEASDKQKSETSFPHSSQFPKEEHSKDDPLDFCVNTFRTMRQLIDNSGGKQSNTQASMHIHIHPPQREIQPQISEQIPSFNSSRINDQPYIYIFIIGVILVAGFALYKVKINSLLNELENIESQTDRKFDEIQKKLGRFEQMQRMYEVYWDKMVFSSYGKQKIPGDFYEFLIFEGRFLTQETFVYAIKQSAADVVSIEHQLNCLLNCSAKNICKLYYYTRNSEFLLIFTEKITPISRGDCSDILNVTIKNDKAIMNDILDAANYLDERIELNCLPFESVMLQKVEIAAEKEGQKPETSLKIRINIVPALLHRPESDSDQDSVTESEPSEQLRHDIVNLCNFIITKGKCLNFKKCEEDKENKNDHLEEFFDFILSEGLNVKGERMSTQIARKGSDSLDSVPRRRGEYIEEALNHPYLWDNKRRMLFLSDFSNYLETCVDEQKGKKLESYAKELNIVKLPWMDQFHPSFAHEINLFRKYDPFSFRDLIRAIRNKLNHFHELPKDIKAIVGRSPDAFMEYCLTLFPKLLQFSYVYSRKKKWKLHAN